MTRPDRLVLVCPDGCRLAHVRAGDDGTLLITARRFDDPLLWLDCRHRRHTVPPMTRGDVQQLWAWGSRGRVVAYDPANPYFVDYTSFGFDPSDRMDDVDQ